MKPVLERIKLKDRQSILAFHHSEKNFETPWHFHPQHELTLIEESVGTKFIGDFVRSAIKPGPSYIFIRAPVMVILPSGNIKQ